MASNRNWCYTLNNYTDEEYEHLKSIRAVYHVCGKEEGLQEQTPHLQGFVVFKSAKTLSAAKKCLGKRMHLEPKKGTFQDASNYCKKGIQDKTEWKLEKHTGENWGRDADYFEEGVLPMDPKDKGDSEKERYQKTWQLAKEGRMEEIDGDIRVRLYGTLRRIEADYQVRPNAQEQMDFHWWCGPSGTGKSRTAAIENPGYYDKPLNKWWDRYDGRATVVIEEWSPDVVPALQQMLKRWADHHPFNGEIKGGFKFIRPPKIIVTSNYTLEECFGHDVIGLLEPMQRRFQVRYFSAP